MKLFQNGARAALWARRRGKVKGDEATIGWQIRSSCPIVVSAARATNRGYSQKIEHEVILAFFGGAPQKF